MTELSLHLQSVGWAAGWKRSNWMKLVDPPASNPFPWARTIGRVFAPDADVHALIRKGAAGAREWFNRQLPILEAAPYVYAWEDVNEPDTYDPEILAQLPVFTSTWVDLMHARGWKTVVYNLAVGHPDIGKAAALAAGLARADFFGSHEYWWDMDADYGWYWGRYKKTVAELKAAGARVPPILITECGVGNRAGTQGYHGVLTDDQYLTQLACYGKELAKDGVEAAFTFTAMPNHPWYSFEVSEAFANRMQVHFASAAPPLPDVPPVIVPPVIVPPVVQPEKPLRWPFLRAWPISSTFAEHKQRKPPSTAPGIDIAAPHGRPIRAPLTGLIKGCQWRSAGGRSMWIVSGEWKVYLAHMSSVVMLSGESCKAGDVVGYVGSTGHSTGPHLHLSVQRNGEWVPPMAHMEKPE